MLQQTDIAGHKRWRSKSKYLPEREIPWHDREDWPEWFIVDITPSRVRLCRLVLKEPLRVLGVKSTAPRTFHDFFYGCSEQLSHFECDDFGEFVFFLQQQLSDGLHHFRALAKRNAAIFPGRVLGVLQSFLDFGVVERSKLLYLFARSRINRSDRHMRTLHRILESMKLVGTDLRAVRWRRARRSRPHDAKFAIPWESAHGRARRTTIAQAAPATRREWPPARSLRDHSN